MHGKEMFPGWHLIWISPVPRFSEICGHQGPLAADRDAFVHGTQACPRPGSHYIIFSSSTSLHRLLGRK